MNVQVDQRCPSCGTDIHAAAELQAVTGTGLLRELTAEWTCPGCQFEYERTIPVDMDMIEQSGFESWVGSVEGEPLCLIVDDGADVVDNGENTVREDYQPRSGTR